MHMVGCHAYIFLVHFDLRTLNANMLNKFAEIMFKKCIFGA